VHLVCAFGQETGDVRLVEKMSDVLGEEEHPGIAEKEFGTGTLGGFDVDQNVLGAGAAGDAAQPEPGIVLLPVEVLGVAELRTDGGIEADSPLAAEEIPDLVAAELLGDGALSPEITVAALNGLGFTFADRHHDDLADSLQQDLDRRIAVAGDVLDASPQRVGIGNPLNGSVVAHSQQDPAPCCIGKAYQLAGKGRG